MKNNNKDRKCVLIRTDRIGEVLLSSVCASAIKTEWPGARVSFVTSSYARDVLAMRADIDEVITFDTSKKENLFIAAFRLASLLRERRFDTALVMNPQKVLHLACFLAGIPERVGYDRKWGALLNRTIKDERDKGEKHEVAYAMDLLGEIGVQGKATLPVLTVAAKDRTFADELLFGKGVRKDRALIAIHAGTSNPAKMWPKDRYAELVKKLKDLFPCDVVLLGDQNEKILAREIASLSGKDVVDLAGRLSLRELAAVIERADIFIGNDTGPMHMAAALGVPVVAIFGRNIKGVSPTRWRPWGEGHVVLHEAPSCDPCYDTSCPYEYMCLKNVTVDAVLNAAVDILKRCTKNEGRRTGDEGRITTNERNTQYSILNTSHDFKRVLIANIFGIGDVLFTTPLIASLKKNIKGITIDYLCNARTKGVLESVPDVEKIFVYEKDDFLETWKRSKGRFLKEVLGLFNGVRRMRYDAVLDLTMSREFGFFFLAAGIPKRIGLDYKKRGVFLTHKRELGGFEDRHVIEHYLDLLRMSGMTDLVKETQLAINEVLRKKMEGYLKGKGFDGGKFVLIVPGGGASWGKHAFRKRWSADNFALVADALVKQGFTVIVAGDPSEREVCDEVARKMDKRPLFVENGLDIRDYIALVSLCDLVVCNDGGPLHIAVALGIKTVSVFGPVDEMVYGPYPPSARHRVVINKACALRPCYNRFKLPDCDHANECLSGISADEVASACVELLKEA